MQTTILRPFAHTLQTSEQWMSEIMSELHTEDPAKANRALRAVMHALRDRLTPSEAAHLSAQLPMLIRGSFYEGWDPDRAPDRSLRSREAFLQRIARDLRPDPEIAPLHAIRAVLTVMSRHITGGEIEDVRRMLPEDIRALWPEAVAAAAPPDIRAGGG